MKKIVVLVLFSTSLFSQGNQSHEEYMKRVLNSTQSPNAFVFSDYSKEGNVDVSTGRFGINIPFTTIENQYLSLPVSLSYSTSGVKVDENASEIGMGWNLIAGGQISRKVNGGADDMNVGTNDANLFIKRLPATGSSPYIDWLSDYSPLSMKPIINGSAKRIKNDNVESTSGYLSADNEFYSKYFPLPRKVFYNASPLTSDYPMISIMDMVNNKARVDARRDIFQVTVGDLNFHFILKLKEEILNQFDLIAHRGRLNWNLFPRAPFDIETNYIAIPLDDNDIKIDIIRGYGDYFYIWRSGIRQRVNTPNDFFTGFVVTDKRGIQYYFENYIFTEPQHIATACDHSSYSPDHFRTIQGLMQDVQMNNWVLSKIIFPNNEIIFYDYLKSRITEPKIVPREHDGEYTGFPYNLRPQKIPYGFNSIDFEYEKLYIERIRSRNKSVQFNYDDNPRIDLQNGRRLKNIQLFDLNNSLIKQLDLISGYKGVTSSNNYLSQRLFLNSLIEKSITDRRNIQYDDSKNVEYTFDYYYPDNLPNKNAIGFQDLYGYNLGNTIENAYPPFPKLYINPNDEGNKISYYPIKFANSITFNGAERRPNANAVYFGTMKEIKFPTRGSLEIVYEPNQFYATSTLESNLNGPGCRVTNLKYYSQQNTLVKNKRYNYELFDGQGTSSGMLMYKPSFAYVANYVINNSMNLSAEQTQQYPNNQEVLFYNLFYKYTTTKEVLNQSGITDLPTLYKKLITTSTHPIGPQSDYFGRDMIYTNVLEEDVSVLDSITTNGITKYYNYYTDNRTEVNVISGPTTDFTYIPPCSKDVLAIPDGVHYAGEDISNAGSSAIYPWRIDGGYGAYGGIKVKYGFIEKKGKDIFPFPERNYFNNDDALKIGKTYKIEYFNNSNVKVQEKNYTYSLINDSSYKTLNFNINYIDTYYHRANDSNYRYSYGSVFKAGLYFYTIDSLYTKQKMVLSSQETIQYANNGEIRERIDNNYNNHFQLAAQNTTNSQNEILETKYYTPSDLPGEPLVADLIAKNMITVPLKTETYKNTQKLSERLSEYTQTPNNLLLPKYMYANKGVAAIVKNTDKKITYDQYDDIGNVLQYTSENGISVSIIWGYNQTQPVAKVENATQAQIAALNLNMTLINDSTTTDSAMQAELQKLRTGISNAMVSTYTYIPLIGVSTITDPKGDTITYNYDSFGRLQNVKDKDGNILSENEYHYKN